MKSLYSGKIAKHINKQDLKDMVVPVPSLLAQKLIIDTNRKLNNLEKTILNFKEELSLNPNSADLIQSNINNILLKLNMLSEADKIKSLIRKGESKHLEFKQTLSLDIRKNKKEKYIEKMALKTIVGFINSYGGDLLVGVKNDMQIFGLDEEIKRYYQKSEDKFLLHFKNLIKARIGEEFYPLIDYNLVKIDEKRILRVNCSASDEPCFLDGKDFYIRTNPATDKLEGTKLIAYIKRRFEK
jgi:hypothetical protein